MKTIYKILLTPVALALVFAICSGLFWCLGSLLLLMYINFLPHYDDVYTFAETVVVGGLHLLVLIVIIMVLLGSYSVIDSIFESPK